MRLYLHWESQASPHTLALDWLSNSATVADALQAFVADFNLKCNRPVRLKASSLQLELKSGQALAENLPLRECVSHGTDLLVKFTPAVSEGESAVARAHLSVLRPRSAGWPTGLQPYRHSLAARAAAFIRVNRHRTAQGLPPLDICTGTVSDSKAASPEHETDGENVDEVAVSPPSSASAAAAIARVERLRQRLGGASSAGTSPASSPVTTSSKAKSTADTASHSPAPVVAPAPISTTPCPVAAAAAAAAPAVMPIVQPRVAATTSGSHNSSPVPSTSHIVQSNCSFCGTTQFFQPEWDRYTCHACSNGCLPAECPRCAHLFNLRDDGQPDPITCGICQTSSSHTACITSRADSFEVRPEPWKIPTEAALPDSKQQEIHLIQQYYTDRDAVRQTEIDECLRQNVACKHIRHIHMLTEQPYDFRKFNAGDKIVQYVVGSWLKYSDIFDYANRFLRGRICMFANSDINFDDTLGRIRTLDMRGRCLALSRHDITPHGLAVNVPVAPVSQDAWIFSSPLPGVVVSDYNIGKPGCDNRIAYELRRVGLRVTNPAHCIVLTHRHASDERNYVHGKDTVKGAYAPVIPVPNLV